MACVNFKHCNVKPKNDLTGNKFFALTVICPAGKTNSSGEVVYLCLCECGEHVYVRQSRLLNNETKACNKDNARSCHHGLSRTSEYRAWESIKKRCMNKNNKDYPNYGGRGICVCKEWQESFECFLKDMGKRPLGGYEIDRDFNDGDYEKNNCKWVTKKQNNRNKRTNRMIKYLGETHCVAEWAEKFKVEYPKMYRTLRKFNWSIEQALLNNALTPCL